MNRSSSANAWFLASMTIRAAVCVLVTMLTFWMTAPNAFAQAPAPSASATPAHHHRSDLDDELPPDVREKLTPEQLHDVMVERAKRPAPPMRDGGKVEILVPLGFFGMIIGILGMALYAGFRAEKQRHETMRLVIERGGQIPTELLVRQVHPRADLRRGLLLTSVGVALGVLIFATDPGTHSWTVGLVPTFLGLAYLAMYRFERGAAKNDAKLAA